VGKCRRYSDWLRAGRPRARSLSPGRGKNFIVFKSSRLVLRPTQPPIQWVTGALSPGVKRSDVKLPTHLQIVPSSRKHGSIHPLPHTPSRRTAKLEKHRVNFTFLTLYICRI
jgi:hypothetical protein